MNKRAAAIWIAFAVALGFGAWMLTLVDRPFLANITFLVAGALVAIAAQLTIEAGKRADRIQDVAGSLYHELANRLARCVFDFEKPFEKWGNHRDVGDAEVDVLRLRRFMAIAPTIYPAIAGEISLLAPNAGQAIINFYARFEIYRTDMEALAKDCELRELTFVPPKHVAILAGRLKRTLRPGLQALRALAALVPNHKQIDAEAIGDLDSLGFKHEREHLTLQQRLEHYEPKVF